LDLTSGLSREDCPLIDRIQPFRLEYNTEMTLAPGSMFCPACGAENQRANSYCKRCGEWLPDIKARTRITFGGETPQQNIFTGLFMSALSSVAALFSAIALYATYLGSGDAKWSVYVAAAICLCIAGWQASSFVVGLKLRQRLKRAHEDSASVAALGTEQPVPALGPADMKSLVNPACVTENTNVPLETVRSHERDTQR